MNEEKLQIINKSFNNDSVRAVWEREEEKYYISVVDVVRVLTNSKNPRHYWNVLKGRLKEEGNESVTNCDQLKLKAADSKYYLTDVCHIEDVFRIIESIPSKSAFKQWLARLGKERIDETFDPSISLQRAIDLYRMKGYDETWISRRIRALQERKQLTDLSEEATKRIAQKKTTKRFKGKYICR